MEGIAWLFTAVHILKQNTLNHQKQLLK